MSPTPEQVARQQIDTMLEAAGWVVQDYARVNPHAARGVAIREFTLKTGHGFADSLLYVDGRAAGVIEAKASGTTLSGVEIQSDKYRHGLPDGFDYLVPLCTSRPRGKTLPFTEAMMASFKGRDASSSLAWCTTK